MRYAAGLCYMIAIFVRSALACSCPPVDHACEVYRWVPIIFAGTVSDLGSKEINSNAGSYSQQVRFAVDEPFKGVSTENIVVKAVHQQSSCPSFLPDFTIGGHYLVLALQDEQGSAFVSDCTLLESLKMRHGSFRNCGNYEMVPGRRTFSGLFSAPGHFRMA